MQDGSVTVERRKRGPDVWSFRWRESGPDGRRVHRRIVLGSADDLKSLSCARKMVVGPGCGSPLHAHDTDSNGDRDFLQKCNAPVRCHDAGLVLKARDPEFRRFIESLLQLSDGFRVRDAICDLPVKFELRIFT